MADVESKLEDNIPGKFYVDEECIDCDLCREIAPTMYHRNDDGGYSFVARQPEGKEEEGYSVEAQENMLVSIENFKESLIPIGSEEANKNVFATIKILIKDIK